MQQRQTRLRHQAGHTVRETYDAVFFDDGQLFVVGTFHTPDEVDTFATQFMNEIKYLGASRRMNRTDLVAHIARRDLAMTLAGLPGLAGMSSSRRIGRISRWASGESYGFLVDAAGLTWFISRTGTPAPLEQELENGTQVSFSSNPNAHPGKSTPARKPSAQYRSGPTMTAEHPHTPPVPSDDVFYVDVTRRGRIRGVQIGPDDIRAADDVLVYFDYARNGWVIAMRESRERDGYMETVREDVEVAFVPA